MFIGAEISMIRRIYGNHGVILAVLFPVIGVITVIGGVIKT